MNHPSTLPPLAPSQPFDHKAPPTWAERSPSCDNASRVQSCSMLSPREQMLMVGGQTS